MSQQTLDTTFIESAPCVACTLSSEGKILTVNNLFNKYFEKNIEAIRGKDFISFLNLDTDPDKVKLFSPANDKKEIKFEYKHKSNSLLSWLEWNFKKINGSGNSEDYLIGFGWDITEKKEKETQLLKDQFFFNLLMDNITDQIYFKDEKSRFLKISRTLAKKQRINSPEDAIGKTDFDLFTKEHAQQAFNDEMEIIKTGKLLENIEEQETWTNGRITWVSTTKVPYRDDKGKIIGTFGVSRDITSRKLAQDSLKKSEEKLRELNAVKDKFFSIVAHDLKSPFNGLFGLVDILINDIDNLSKDQVKQTLSLLFSEMKQVYQLLEDLLEWGRIQRNAIQYEPEVKNISAIIKNIVDLYAVNARNKNISILLNIPEEEVIKIDVKMISTVIRNLLTNAIKFTHAGGNIQIKAEDKEKEIKISVVDNGVGIPANRIHNLFDLTEYFSTKGTAQESGTGLGLILCKEFVEKHGGKISVETEINKGSTFSFTIPKNM
jgi:two-component system, sensor histidine kinase and response regulator